MSHTNPLALSLPFLLFYQYNDYAIYAYNRDGLMSRLVKILLIAAGSLAALLVIAAIVAVILFPADKVRALVEETGVPRALGMPVSVGDIGLSFRGIPSVRGERSHPSAPARSRRTAAGHPQVGECPRGRSSSSSGVRWK